MSILDVQVESLDGVDPAYHGLYTESGGAFKLTGVNGLKTESDVSAVQEALRKEKEDHKASKAKLQPWGELNPQETLAQLDRIKELEAAAGGKLDEDKLNELVEGRLAQKTGPLERDLTTANESITMLTAEIESLREEKTQRIMGDSINEAALKMKVRPEAMDDVRTILASKMEITEDGKVITKDGAGVTAGLNAEQLLKELQTTKFYWWPDSAGGGAGGGSAVSGFTGNNPFSAKHWNMTQQGKIVRENRALADNLAKAAGTTVGGRKPAATT